MLLPKRASVHSCPATGRFRKSGCRSASSISHFHVEINTEPRSSHITKQAKKARSTSDITPSRSFKKKQKRRFPLPCAARYRTQPPAPRPISPCGGDLSGRLNAGASAPAGQPANVRRTPPVARSLSRSRSRRWCRPVGRRDGGRVVGGGVGLAHSRAWGGWFGGVVWCTDSTGWFPVMSQNATCFHCFLV